MSPFTKAQYIDAITNALSYLKSQVELNNAINKYSINIEAEDFYAGFLNVVFGFRLENANHAEKNIASIDLYEEYCRDDGQRVAVQVTSKNDAVKIKKTLESFSKYEYQKAYTRLIILMITTKRKYRTEFSFTGESEIEFDPQRDILDVKDLLNHINSITDMDHLGRIYEYLNKELPPAILNFNGKDDTNVYRTNDNGLFSRLMNIFSNDRSEHPSIKMMDPDPMLFPTGLPEIRSDLRSAIVESEPPRAIKDMILDSWKRDKKRHILLVGEGGIGKTVAMLTLPKEEWFRRYRIPMIYVPLQRLDKREGKLDDYLEDKLGAIDYNRIIELANQKAEGHPRLLLLLDGFNEIPDKFKGTTEKFIRDWMEKPGVQIITTSRLGFSLENRFSKYLLQTLPRETVRSFLLSAGVREEHFPKENDRIWDVINVPLMLTLYTQIDKVKEISDCSFVASLLDWREADNAAHIIWNYLQTEVYRCIDKAGTSYSPMQYVTAILAIAPYVCCQMSRKMKYYIDQEELLGFIREALFFYGGRQNMVGRQFMNIRRKYDRYAEENLFEEELIVNYSRILVENIALFREQETCDENGGIEYIYSLTHQNFRDAQAAFFISLCLSNIIDGSDRKSLLDHVDYYVKNYIAEFLSDNELLKIWDKHRDEEPEDGHVTWILMDILGRQRNYDYRALDFSGLDLTKTNIHRLLSRRLDICPLPEDRKKFAKTKISYNSFSPKGHSSAVNSVAYSPDGRYLASGAEDKTVRVWDLESGDSHILKGHTGYVNCVAYSPNGRYLASGADDRRVYVWNLDTGETFVLKGHTYWVRSVAFSSDGRHIASGAFDRTVRIWNFVNGESQVLEGHADSVSSVAYSPNGRYLASGGFDKTVRIWDLESGENRVLEGHVGWVRSVAFSQDGKHIASSSDDRTVRIWDLESGKNRVLEGHLGWVNSVMFSPDGRHIASSSDDGALRVWDLESGESRVLEGHSGYVKGVAYSPDGRHIASCAIDKTVRIWDLESDESRILEGLAGWVRSVAYSPDGRYLAIGADDRTVRIWDLKSGESRVLESLEGGIRSVAYSQNGRQLAIGAFDSTVRLWNLESGECQMLEDCVNGVRSVAHSPDGKYLAVAVDDKTIRIWNLETGENRMLKGHTGWVNSVMFSPDGIHLASGSDDHMVRIWDLDSGESRVLEGNVNKVNCVIFSPDGIHIASGGTDHTVQVWNLETGEKQILKGHKGWVRSLAYSPDGRHLASGANDSTVRIWNVESGECNVLKCYLDGVWSVEYSPDGKYLAIGAYYSTVRIWNLEECLEEKRFEIIPRINLSGANFELADISENNKKLLNWAGAKV